jgi:DNA repair exonuclease SbcCD ATPase subunit
MNRAAPVLDWRPVAETLSAIDAEYADIDALVEELFAELEKRRSELAHQAVELERQRREAEARSHELEAQREENRKLIEQFDRQERRLADTLALLEGLKQGLDHAPASADRAVDVVPFQNAVERLANECESLRKERDAFGAALEAAQSAAPQWEKIAAEVERLGSSLEERLQAISVPAAAPVESERVSLLEQERSALVAELEQVRARSAELHENLLDQQREHGEQNARLADEIQSLRQLVERQAEMLNTLAREGLSGGPSDHAEPVVPRSDSSAPAADPVVSSVMAQFAELQKDLAKRRKRK